jgi:uncharacterized protein YndB with AHSA1/START domain
MPVVSTEKDLDALTLTLIAEFNASVERVWQVWEDPRQLEQWWGPPTWPATFNRHELKPGGEMRYYMTGPDGTKSAGWWTVTAIDAPHRLEFEDGFADKEGEPSRKIAPTQAVITLEPIGEGTRMTSVTKFPSIETMEQILKLGIEEGSRLAMSQIDEVLLRQ